jgi:alkanesulfonate monooxygenase SsuD/methylene tetrahydromethanopterin reductase-like flavin-dependent oxidoreductase (luciferase family)
VIAGVNVLAAGTAEEARKEFHEGQRRTVELLLGRGRRFTPEEADEVLESPAGQQVRQMGRYSAVGTPAEAREYLDWFTTHADADELIVVTRAGTEAGWLKSYELLAEVTRNSMAGGLL